jgi:uncharacterized membrane protein YeaQ/YmgE (transglycosylase-associated protein family)
MNHAWYVWILIGLVAGSLAGRLTGVRPRGCCMTTLVGIAGAFIGGLVLSHYREGDSPGIIASTIVAFVFAAIFLGVLRLLGVAQPRGNGYLDRPW